MKKDTILTIVLWVAGILFLVLIAIGFISIVVDIERSERTQETVVTVRDPYTKEVVFVHTHDGAHRVCMDDGVYTIFIDGEPKSFSGYLIESTVRSK